MQTMTAPQIADLHARRAMAGLGRVPPLGQCLTAALAKRLYDVDTSGGGHDCLWIADDAEAALAGVAAAASPDDTAVPAGWSAERVFLDPSPRVWAITGTTGSLRFRCGPTRTADSLRAEVGDWQLFERDLGLDARAPDLGAAAAQVTAWSISDAPDDGGAVYHDFTKSAELPAVATDETSRPIAVYDPQGHCVTGGHCVARFRADGSAYIEGACPDEAGGCPSTEIEECLAGESTRPEGHAVQCDTTMGTWSVRFGG